MPSRLTTLFFKSAVCPSSQLLLAYQESRLNRDQMNRVKSHLAYCDFCNAELQLLSRHRIGEEEFRIAEIPVQLRWLAERLLKTDVVFSSMRNAH
jgi:hypothetical protein